MIPADVGYYLNDRNEIVEVYWVYKNREGETVPLLVEGQLIAATKYTLSGPKEFAYYNLETGRLEFDKKIQLTLVRRLEIPETGWIKRNKVKSTGFYYTDKTIYEKPGIVYCLWTGKKLFSCCDKEHSKNVNPRSIQDKKQKLIPVAL